jgi:hypothetical protein
VVALAGRGLLRAVVSSAAGVLQDEARARVRFFGRRAHVAVRGLRPGDLPEAAATKLAKDVERRSLAFSLALRRLRLSSAIVWSR